MCGVGDVVECGAVQGWEKAERLGKSIVLQMWGQHGRHRGVEVAPQLQLANWLPSLLLLGQQDEHLAIALYSSRTYCGAGSCQKSSTLFKSFTNRTSFTCRTNSTSFPESIAD